MKPASTAARIAACTLALLVCAQRPAAGNPPAPSTARTCRVGQAPACPAGTVCVNLRPDRAECRTPPPEAPLRAFTLPVDARAELLCTHGSGEGSHSWENAYWALDLSSPVDRPAATIRASAEGVAYVFPREGPCPTPPGTAARSENSPCGQGWGNHVKVLHGGGYFSLYAHLERVLVRDGQRVAQGEALGVEGATGMAGHRHLHWSVQRLAGASEAEWLQHIDWIGDSVPFRFEASVRGARATLSPATLVCPHAGPGELPPEVQPHLRGVLDAAPAAPRPLDGVSVAVVATLHAAHLHVAGYPVALLGEVMRAARPDLVLVEIRPEPFAAGHLEDGPFEMTYATLVARERGIAVEPIDWWQESDVGAPEPRLAPDASAAFEREMAPLRAAFQRAPDFATANSGAQAAVVAAMRNVEGRYFDGNPVWSRRQSWFHHRAMEAITRRRARRALAFVGAEHRPELAAWLATQGAEVLDPLSLGVSAADVPAGARAPEAVVAAWREGAARLRAATGTGPLAVALRRKARYFELAA